jgi:hypothetical protein
VQARSAWTDASLGSLPADAGCMQPRRAGGCAQRRSSRGGTVDDRPSDGSMRIICLPPEKVRQYVMMGINLCFALTYFGCPVALLVGDLATAELYVRLLLEQARRHGSIRCLSPQGGERPFQWKQRGMRSRTSLEDPSSATRLVRSRFRPRESSGWTRLLLLQRQITHSRCLIIATK